MNAVTRQDQLPGMPEPADLLGIISRAASDPNVDVSKMQGLFSLYERFQLKNAEAAYNTAMTAAQSEMKRISADMENKQTRSNYASYGQIDRHLRPIYSRHGFALSFNTGKPETPDTVLVLCTVSHASGFSKEFSIPMPADGKGAKGGDVMTKTHASGAAVTYGMRYLLKMIFNVAIGEDDSDGNAPEDLVTDEQIATIQALMEEVAADRAKFLAYLKVDSLGQILAKNYSWVVGLLEKKRG